MKYDLIFNSPEQIANKHKISKQFIEGFMCGLLWPDQWETHGKPGGPWVSDDQTREENKSWKSGWEYGHHCKESGERPNMDPYAHMREKK